MVTIPMSPLAGGLGPYVTETLATIRERVGLLMHVLIVGQLTAATASSFSMEQLKKYPNDAEPAVGKVAYIVDGTGAGQLRTVTATVGSTGTGSVSPNWTVTPDTTSIIEIWADDLTPEEVNNAINLAIVNAQELVLVPDRQNPASIDTTYYRELAAPSGFVYVYALRYKDSSGYWREYRPTDNGDGLSFGAGDRNFFVNGSTLVIRPDLSASVSLGDIWVLGYRRPALLVNDDDVSDVRTDFLVFKAATLLDEGRASGGEVDPNDHGGRAANWTREYLEIRTRMQTALEPNTVELKP